MSESESPIQSAAVYITYSDGDKVAAATLAVAAYARQSTSDPMRCKSLQDIYLEMLEFIHQNTEKKDWKDITSED